MWATAFATARRLRLEIAWAIFAIANLVVLWVIHDWETVPFHFIWVSLTLLYGYRTWPLKPTLVVLVIVCLTTGFSMAHAVAHGPQGLDELTEVPLMGAMFGATVWHARRRQAALDEVRRVHERERAFVRDASHQLRTPITVARCHAEVIQASASGEMRRDAEVVIDELGRLSVLAEQLLTLAAAQDPRRFLRREPLDLGDLAREVIDRWRATAPRRWEATVTTEGVVPADGERLVVALDALLENAVFATEEADTITVSLHGESGTAVLRVTDTGIGMTRAMLDHVFEPFAALRSVGAGQRRGTGLGLAIVKAVVDGHDGSATVESRPGEGTVVGLRLPGFEPRRAPVARALARLGVPA
jgi:two-component system OmpR family sensor kinase